MVPLSKRKSYTNLVTSMGAGDSEPDEERIITTLARHMARAGMLESGLTKHMNQVRLKHKISEDITSYPEYFRTHFNSNKTECLLDLLSLAVLKEAALKEIVRGKNWRATSSGSLPTATKSLLVTIRRRGEVRNIQLGFSEESRRVKMYLEDKHQGNQLQRSTGNADNPALGYDEFLHEIKRSMLFEPEEEEICWYSLLNGKASKGKEEPSFIVLSWIFTSALHHMGCLDGQPPDQDDPYTFYIQPKLDRNAGTLDTFNPRGLSPTKHIQHPIEPGYL
ncbi:hypothetical protein AARAC_010605 [Aspergillus arachidicola]|uniref:Uncharacterized protein n=1 Tax=Aspergillus arachidicola TaxID=656916 RepID=A0A2G7GBP0_9EURO|nr:hypothetical protein AARAC_010605 [Aspergillus arachidicola]